MHKATAREGRKAAVKRQGSEPRGSLSTNPRPRRSLSMPGRRPNNKKDTKSRGGAGTQGGAPPLQRSGSRSQMIARKLRQLANERRPSLRRLSRKLRRGDGKVRNGPQPQHGAAVSAGVDAGSKEELRLRLALRKKLSLADALARHRAQSDNNNNDDDEEEEEEVDEFPMVRQRTDPDWFAQRWKEMEVLEERLHSNPKHTPPAPPRRHDEPRPPEDEEQPAPPLGRLDSGNSHVDLDWLASLNCELEEVKSRLLRLKTLRRTCSVPNAAVAAATTSPCLFVPPCPSDPRPVVPPSPDHNAPPSPGDADKRSDGNCSGGPREDDKFRSWTLAEAYLASSRSAGPLPLASPEVARRIAALPSGASIPGAHVFGVHRRLSLESKRSRAMEVKRARESSQTDVA